jgi:beta-phosphoglucomutase-like phosphatase (HAD superfamily)
VIDGEGAMWRLLRKFDETLRKSAGVKHPPRPPWPPCENRSAKFAHAPAHNVLSADRMALPEQVSGLLIDIDGTVTEAHSLVPGVPEALALLQARNVPYRLVTNTTSKPRSAILTQMRSLGLEVPADAVITAPIIGREYLLHRGLTRCYPLLERFAP